MLRYWKGHENFFRKRLSGDSGFLLRGAALSSCWTHRRRPTPKCLFASSGFSEKPHSFHANRTQLQEYTPRACQRSQTHTLCRWPRQHGHAHMQDTNVEGWEAGFPERTPRTAPAQTSASGGPNEAVKNTRFSKSSDIISISESASIATLQVQRRCRCDEEV